MLGTYKAIVSGHIWMNEGGEKEIEILCNINNDYFGTDIFCGVEQALIDTIFMRGKEDYYFIAMVRSRFLERISHEGIDYDVEHEVKEISPLDVSTIDFWNLF
ncbi:hypothetical protein D1872_81580 [compost metagenome]